MEQFSLEKWLQDKSRKVVTRDGRKVDIYYSPSPINRISLIGRTSDNEVHQYTEDGFQCDTINQAKNDLFFADEEEHNSIIDEFKSYLENTAKEQFEKDWQEIQDWYNQHYADKSNKEEELTEFEKAVDNIINYPHFQDEQAVKQLSRTLLDLARKELERKNIIVDEDKYLRICDYYYEQGKQDALKDLPKWKKATKCKNFDNHVILFGDKDRVVLTTEIYEDERYIELDDLKTLPKEE